MYSAIGGGGEVLIVEAIAKYAERVTSMESKMCKMESKVSQLKITI